MSQVSTCFSFTLDGWAIFSSEPASYDQTSTSGAEAPDL